MNKNIHQLVNNDKWPVPTYSDEKLGASSGIDTFVMRVGPKEASALLCSNISNRPVNDRHVALLANSMKKGEWKLNGEPLIFFKDGTLGNGQHRLYAVVLSETTQMFLVVRGVEKDTFQTMDGGRKRGAQDVLSLAGEANAVSLAATARAFLAYHLTGRNASFITSSQVLQCVNDNPDLRKWNSKRISCKTISKFPSALAAYATISARKHGDESIVEFFEQLNSGVGLEKGSPALLLRDRLMANQVSKLSKQMQNALIIKAMNAHTQCRLLGVLRWQEAENFPSIV